MMIKTAQKSSFFPTQATYATLSILRLQGESSGKHLFSISLLKVFVLWFEVLEGLGFFPGDQPDDGENPPR